jgi:hypothetical protein
MDSNLSELRSLADQSLGLVYEAVKAGIADQLPPEYRALAQAVEEHRHLSHVHNALEFADVREGEPYEVIVDGNPVNPLAHVSIHAAVKEQIASEPVIRAAFEKMVAIGFTPHHAEHVLMGMLMELLWEISQPRPGAAKARALYMRNLKKLDRDKAYRRKLTDKFGPGHFALE